MRPAGFPLLENGYDGAPFVYLDSASTTPKPREVIAAVARYYETLGANVHRGVYPLAEAATEEYERARQRVAALIGAQPAEIVFTRNATDSFNLVARALRLSSDDEVVFPASEHHSNYLPWRVAAKPKLVDIDDEALPKWSQLRTKPVRTRLVSVAHVSNVTGAIAPIEDWIETAPRPAFRARRRVAIGRPSAARRTLGVDFLGLGPKMFGPNGVGVLYVRRDRFAEAPGSATSAAAWSRVADDRFEPLEAPFRYEAGTPNVEGVIGLGAAVDYLRKFGMANVAAHSRALAAQLIEGLAGLPEAMVLGRSARDRIALATVSMPWPAMRQQDIARLLADAHAIFVSGGFHCAHVLHHRLKLDGTLRASAHLYNDSGDIEAFIRALHDL
jgi:cysteine desulfurase/selenocysteine lyase